MINGIAWVKRTGSPWRDMPERYGPWKTAHLRRAFDPSAYKNRNQVERGFGRRKHRRGMATRFDKLATSDQATLDLVETLDWLRSVPDSATDDPRVTP